MIRTISPETFEFLKKEIALWEEGNILKREQGESIIASYEIRQTRSVKITLFMFCGCMLLGTSLTALVGLNNLNLTQKYELLFFLVAAFAALIYQGWNLIGTSRTDRTLAEVHLLLGTIAFADATALATQMFNFTTSQNWEVAACAACMLPIALLTRSAPMVIVCNSAIAFWSLSNELPQEYRIAAGAIALMSAYFLRNRWALALALVTCPIAMITYNSWDHAPAVSLMVGMSLIAWHMWHIRSGIWRSMATPYLLAGVYLVSFQSWQQLYGWNQEKSALIPEAFAIALAVGACLCRSRKLLFARVSTFILIIVLTMFTKQCSTFVDIIPYLLTNILLLLYCAKAVDNPWFIGAPLLSVCFCMFRVGSDQIGVVAALTFVAGCVVLLSAIMARRQRRVSLVTIHQPQTLS